MEKWFVMRKGAAFEEIAKKFNIHPVIARLIRNRDIIGDENIQKYLQRLVMNEGAIGDQVENRRKQLELANRLEEDLEYDEEFGEDVEIEYEGAAQLEEMFDDDDALN